MELTLGTLGNSISSNAASVMVSASGHEIPCSPAAFKTLFTVFFDTWQLAAMSFWLNPRLRSLRISRYLVIRPPVYFVRTELCRPKLDRFPCLRNRGFRLTGTPVSITPVSWCNSLRNTHEFIVRSLSTFMTDGEERKNGRKGKCIKPALNCTQVYKIG